MTYLARTFYGTHSFSVRCLSAAAAMAALLVFPAFLVWLHGTSITSYLPSQQVLALGALGIGFTVFLRNEVNRLVALIWLVWFFVGTMNAISAYMVLGSHYRPDLSEPTSIYLSFFAAMCFGMAVGEGWRTIRSRPLSLVHDQDLRTEELIAAVAFVCIWAASIVWSVGYVPIFSGFDLTESLYSMSYGPLYGFGFFVVITAVWLLLRLIRGRSRLYRSAISILLAVTVAASILDGKRFFAILILLAASFVLIRAYGARRARKHIALVSLVAIFLYVGLLILRQGMSVDKYSDGWLSLTFIAGVEYRDFVYTVGRFEPGTIPDYRWLSSSVAAGLNSSILSWFGVSKGLMIEQGSAFAWARIFGSPYGIRTGIVSELWFAYGWGGLGVVSAIGVVSARIAASLQEVNSDWKIANRCILLALLTSLVMGQTTAVTGLMTVLLYANVLLFGYRMALNLSGRRRKSSAAP